MKDDAVSQKGSNDFRREEHAIELIWSVKSGKTRILWNKCKISSTIREGGRNEVLEFTWKTASNDVLKVIAHSSVTAGVQQQYDLLINGVSFFQLPHLSDLKKRNDKSKAKETTPNEGAVERISSCGSIDSLTSSDFRQEMGDPSSSSSFRLSMVGIQSDSMDDELRSELYSSSLDEVRLSVTSVLPQTEEMISRAIMDAFIGDEDETDNCSSSSSSFCVSHDEGYCQLEVNALCDALEWTHLHGSNASRQDEDDLALVFLQKQITNTFSQIRSEQISSQAAIRILVGVASLLGLQFARPMTRNTIIIESVSQDISSSELREFLSTFGFVESFSVSKHNPKFSCCRFVDEQALVALLQAVRENKLPQSISPIRLTTLFGGISPTPQDLSSNTDLVILDKIDEAPEALTPSHLIKLVAHDQPTTPSTCNSPQSLSSLLDFSHFLLEL